LTIGDAFKVIPKLMILDDFANKGRKELQLAKGIEKPHGFI
jgi:hypothetical protein